MKNIYIGNLPHASTEASVRAYFETQGEVASVRIIKDKFTGASRGFAFVEMPNDAEAMNAINNLNGKEFEGRTLRINEAQAPQDRPRTGGVGGGFNRDRGPRRDGGFGGNGFGGGRGGDRRGGNDRNRF